ncbi:hypothetical protein ACFC96_21195 [Streptomyces sp. NPDC055955]|uniref:hypothetical protein n=1 Tax=Streptomyces sp. NPDC055955 TaxID=3345665 RepID=UPI0035D5EC07
MSFADVPAEETTPARHRELAARHNGGPYREAGDARASGRGFTHHLHDARNALRR